MEYINYHELFSLDSISSNDEKFHEIREMYRYFKLLGRYINACIRQYNRLEEWAKIQVKNGSRITTPADAIKTEQVFSDLHFLITSMDKCYDLETKLYRRLFGLEESKKLNKSNDVLYIRTMRNIIEHMDDYLSNNDKYTFDGICTESQWTWLEEQLGTLKQGRFIIGDKELLITPMMFNPVLIPFGKIVDELNCRIAQCTFPT